MCMVLLGATNRVKQSFQLILQQTKHKGTFKYITFKIQLKKAFNFFSIESGKIFINRNLKYKN